MRDQETSNMLNVSTLSRAVVMFVVFGAVSAVGAKPAITQSGEQRPYGPSSPWNTPIAHDPAIDERSPSYIVALADNGMPLTSDPDRYAIPVYAVGADTPKRTVKLTGYFGAYDHGDGVREGRGEAPTVTDVPIPDGAQGGRGTDGQIVLLDAARGIEWGFWRFARAPDGTFAATNGYRYHTTSDYNGRFGDGKAGRGAGTPYLAGLVRRWEVDQGEIKHALAFAYNSPSNQFVYPASKSDGGGSGGTDLPEGTRLQLDPSLTDRDFDAWQLSPAARMIARALQTYGMYVVDHSGSSKVYLEDRRTAHWDAGITRDLLSRIPWFKFRAIAPPGAARARPTARTNDGSSSAPVLALLVVVAGVVLGGAVWFRRRRAARAVKA